MPYGLATGTDRNLATTAIGRLTHEDDGRLLAGSRLSMREGSDSQLTTAPGQFETFEPPKLWR